MLSLNPGFLPRVAAGPRRPTGVPRVSLVRLSLSLHHFLSAMIDDCQWNIVILFSYPVHFFLFDSTYSENPPAATDDVIIFNSAPGPSGAPYAITIPAGTTTVRSLLYAIEICQVRLPSPLLSQCLHPPPATSFPRAPTWYVLTGLPRSRPPPRRAPTTPTLSM